MASRGFFDVTNSSPPTASSPFRSCQSLSSGTDSPIFHSPSSSPDIERMQSGGAAPNENTPLITQGYHYGRAADIDRQGELSMSIEFPSSSSNSFEPKDVPFWTHIK